MVDRQEILKLMDEAEVVYLATIGEKGPRIRALENLRRADQYPDASKFCRNAGLTAYLATSGASNKARDVRATPSVALYYCKPGSYQGVMLSGRAEVRDDADLKKALWSEGWRAFWAGPHDADYVVIRMEAEEVSGWWSGKPFRVEVNAR